MTREYYKHHVFLSYSRQDADMMRRVRDGLRAAGLLVWTDDTGLEPGTPSWEAAIQEAIREAGCMVVLLSPDTMASEWVTRETAFAATWDLRIFPVLVRGNERNAVPLRLTSHQRLDARRDVDRAMRTLVASILRHLTVEPLETLHPTPAPVRSRRGLPIWAWIGVGAAAFMLCIGMVIGGLALSGALGGGGEAVEGPGATPFEIPGNTPTLEPSNTPTHTATATDTPTVTITPTDALEFTETATLTLTPFEIPGGTLDGTSWVLTAYGGTSLIPETTITAAFEEGRVGGSAGCNSYGGPYQVSGNEITVGEIFMTLMACIEPAGVMQQETAFLAFLADAQTFQITGGQLQIFQSDGQALTFAPQE